MVGGGYLQYNAVQCHERGRRRLAAAMGSHAPVACAHGVWFKASQPGQTGERRGDENASTEGLDGSAFFCVGCSCATKPLAVAACEGVR